MWDILVEDVSLCGMDRLTVFRPQKRLFLGSKLKKKRRKKKRMYVCLPWEFHCGKLLSRVQFHFGGQKVGWASGPGQATRGETRHRTGRLPPGCPGQRASGNVLESFPPVIASPRRPLPAAQAAWALTRAVSLTTRVIWAHRKFWGCHSPRLNKNCCNNAYLTAFVCDLRFRETPSATPGTSKLLNHIPSSCQQVFVQFLL